MPLSDEAAKQISTGFTLADEWNVSLQHSISLVYVQRASAIQKDIYSSAFHVGPRVHSVGELHRQRLGWETSFCPYAQLCDARSSWTCLLSAVYQAIASWLVQAADSGSLFSLS